MTLSSLSQIAALLPKNFDDFTTSFPKTTESAEAVYQGFDSLLTQYAELDPTNIQMGVVVSMGFGAQSSWVESYILAAAGHLSSSLADLRRAIEFACYSMKASKSKERASDWVNQGSDAEARKRFALSCAIPLCYEGNKYRNLRELIVQYETANYYGAHGNMQTLIQRLTVDNKGLGFLLHVPKKERSPDAFTTVLTGYRILQVFRDALSPSIRDTQKFKAVMDYIKQQIREARLAMAEVEFGGAVPDHVYRTICLDENPSMDIEFRKIIAEARERKSKPKDV